MLRRAPPPRWPTFNHFSLCVVYICVHVSTCMCIETRIQHRGYSLISLGFAKTLTECRTQRLGWQSMSRTQKCGDLNSGPKLWWQALTTAHILSPDRFHTAHSMQGPACSPLQSHWEDADSAVSAWCLRDGSSSTSFRFLTKGQN